MSDNAGIEAIGIVLRTTDMTIRFIMSLIESTYRKRESLLRMESVKISNIEHMQRIEERKVYGEQPISDLNRQNTKISGLNLSEKSLGNDDLDMLRKQFKHHGVDFSIVTTGENESVLYFKARDKNRIMDVFEIVSKEHNSNIANLDQLMKSANERYEKKFEMTKDGFRNKDWIKTTIPEKTIDSSKDSGRGDL